MYYVPVLSDLEVQNCFLAIPNVYDLLLLRCLQHLLMLVSHFRLKLRSTDYDHDLLITIYLLIPASALDQDSCGFLNFSAFASNQGQSLF